MRLDELDEAFEFVHESFFIIRKEDDDLPSISGTDEALAQRPRPGGTLPPGGGEKGPWEPSYMKDDEDDASGAARRRREEEAAPTIEWVISKAVKAVRR